MSIFAFSQEKVRIWTDGRLRVLSWTVLDVNIIIVIIALSGFAKFCPECQIRLLLTPGSVGTCRNVPCYLFISLSSSMMISQLTFLKAHNIQSIHGASPRFLPPKGWSPPPWLSRFRLKNNGSIRACRGFVSENAVPQIYYLIVIHFPISSLLSPLQLPFWKYWHTHFQTPTSKDRQPPDPALLSAGVGFVESSLSTLCTTWTPYLTPLREQT